MDSPSSFVGEEKEVSGSEDVTTDRCHEGRPDRHLIEYVLLF